MTFQSTHPLRGATICGRPIVDAIPISIHAPLAGCDPVDAASSSVLPISIHAPLAGCDLAGLTNICIPPNFNPRTPCGVRQEAFQNRYTYNQFQSTHPLRGATDRCYQSFYWCTISIHAPLAGCDNAVKTIQTARKDFNPRTPCGVRQQNCRNIPGKFAQKLQNFCKAKQRAALSRVGQRESGRYFRPCAVRTSRGKPERFRFASDNERALRSVARL